MLSNNLQIFRKLSQFQIKLRLCRYIPYNASIRSILHRCVPELRCFRYPQREVHIEWAGDTRPVTWSPHPGFKFTVRYRSPVWYVLSQRYTIYDSMIIEADEIPVCSASIVGACFATALVALTNLSFQRAPATGFNISVGSQARVTETRDITGFSWDLWPEDIEAMTFTGVVGATPRAGNKSQFAILVVKRDFGIPIWSLARSRSVPKQIQKEYNEHHEPTKTSESTMDLHHLHHQQKGTNLL